MSKKSVRSFGPLRAVLLILLVLAVVLLGMYGFLRYRMNRLAEGAAFRLEYTVQSTADTPTSAYNTFQTMKGLTGTVEGQSQTDRFTARLYAQGQTEAFLEVYSGQGETLVNIGRLYRYYVAGLAQEYPLLASLIPDWGLGDYISQQQLARFFDGRPPPRPGSPPRSWSRSPMTRGGAVTSTLPPRGRTRKTPVSSSGSRPPASFPTRWRSTSS